jgi:hypothetical protein
MNELYLLIIVVVLFVALGFFVLERTKKAARRLEPNSDIYPPVIRPHNKSAATPVCTSRLPDQMCWHSTIPFHSIFAMIPKSVQVAFVLRTLSRLSALGRGTRRKPISPRCRLWHWLVSQCGGDTSSARRPCSQTSEGYGLAEEEIVATKCLCDHGSMIRFSILMKPAIP